MLGVSITLERRFPIEFLLLLMEWSCVACGSNRRIWSVLSIGETTWVPSLAQFYHTRLHIWTFPPHHWYHTLAQASTFALACTIALFYHTSLPIYISSKIVDKWIFVHNSTINAYMFTLKYFTSSSFSHAKKVYTVQCTLYTVHCTGSSVSQYKNK